MLPLIVALGLGAIPAWRLHRHQKTRLIVPKKNDTWESLLGEKYRVNGVTDTTVMASTVPNNMGGVVYSIENWRKLVDNQKLFLSKP